MDRKPYRRPSLPLLPLLVAAGLSLWLFNGGCSRLSGLMRLQTLDQRERTARERIEFAVESLQRGDARAADNAIADAVRVLENNSSAVAAVAEELIRRGRPAAASQILTQAVKDQEMARNPMVWARLAEAHRKAGDKAKAGPAEEEAARRADTVLASVGQLPPLKKGNVPPPTFFAAMMLFRETGFYYKDIKQDTPNALTALREALRLMPDNPMLLNDVGYTLAEIGTTPAELNEALNLTRVAVELSPENGQVLDSYGWALYRKRDLAGARRILRTALELSPDIPEIRYHYGVVLAELGQTTQATIEIDRALRLRPDYAPARTLRTILQATSQSADTSDEATEPENTGEGKGEKKDIPPAPPKTEARKAALLPPQLSPSSQP
jgi:Tfp pilus assembly protein PilF